MEVDDPLRATRGARAVEPERHVVAAGVDRLELLRRLELVDEQELRRAHLLRARRIDDREPRAAVLDEVGVVVGPVERVDRNGDGTDPHRPEKRRREPGVVVHDEEHALAALDAEVAKRRARAAHSREELAVGHRLVLRRGSPPCPAPRFEVAIEQQAGVVALGDRDRGHAHARRLTGQSGLHKWRARETTLDDVVPCARRSCGRRAGACRVESVDFPVRRISGASGASRTPRRSQLRRPDSRPRRAAPSRPGPASRSGATP